jgi:hypothetical protein
MNTISIKHLDGLRFLFYIHSFPTLLFARHPGQHLFPAHVHLATLPLPLLFGVVLGLEYQPLRRLRPEKEEHVLKLSSLSTSLPHFVPIPHPIVHSGLGLRQHSRHCPDFTNFFRLALSTSRTILAKAHSANQSTSYTEVFLSQDFYLGFVPPRRSLFQAILEERANIHDYTASSVLAYHC